ncbi:hypothetical protein [Yersinia phage fHe-Yen9-03]|uniref:Uncharacterized protein n=1 Tax=Yersinia phage fHe-Yen9-03 TaxID=2052743 RepID=A0A2C9D1F6_9CAUD|nr:hypothetical protein [Yersinia phage fHe-Yen9-03]
MTLEMIVYMYGEASLIFNYINTHNLNVDSVKLIYSNTSNTNTMVIYVWCNEEQKEEMIKLKNIEDTVL